jgi:hypothetical protein
MVITIESPLKLRKRLLALLSPALREWLQGLQEEARGSLLTLNGLQGTPPEQLVAFYQVVSPWCDRGYELQQFEQELSWIDYGQYRKAREALMAIAAQDERCCYGVNWTSSGETPTVDTTFLGGDRSGLTTNTVTYWEDNRNVLGEEPALLGVANSPTIAQVIDTRALELLTDGLVRWKSLFEDLINS